MYVDNFDQVACKNLRPMQTCASISCNFSFCVKQYVFVKHTIQYSVKCRVVCVCDPNISSFFTIITTVSISCNWTDQLLFTYKMALCIAAIFTKFSQLIFRKIIKIVATRCQILRLKCTKFDFWGSHKMSIDITTRELLTFTF